MKTVSIPVEPTEGILMSMAIRYDHALSSPGFYNQPLFEMEGVTHAMRLESALSIMRQLYEEVARQGFYRDEKEGLYAAVAQASKSTIPK